MSYSNVFQLRMPSLLAITTAVVPLDLLEPRNFQRWVIFRDESSSHVQISGAYTHRWYSRCEKSFTRHRWSSKQTTVLLKAPMWSAKPWVLLLLSTVRALPSSSSRFIVIGEQRCVASKARLSAYVGLPPQTSEQLHGWHLEIQEMIMKTTALSTCMLSGGNYFWKWCAYCLLDLVCCPVSKVLSFLQGLLNDAKSLSTLKVCGRHFGPSWHRGRHLLLSS